MKRIALLLLTALLLSSIAYNQRRLQVVTSAQDWAPETITLNGKVIIAYNDDDHLLIYDDDSITTRYYPTIGGVPLRYHTYDKTSLFRSEIFMSLIDRGTRYLYRFNGTAFRDITIPGRIVSNCIVFGDNLYVLSEIDSRVTLFRYNGSTVAEIPTVELPPSRRYTVFVGNNYLYLHAHGFSTFELDVLKRFNGTTTSTIPYTDLGGGLREVHPVGETGRVYFVFEQRIVYFDGTIATEIYDLIAGYIKGVIWRNELYFISSNSLSRKMYKTTGAALTEIAAPAGSSFYAGGSNPIVYHDTLFVQVDYGGDHSEIVKYDGTSFLPFYSLPGTISSGRLLLRDDDLIIQPDYINGHRAIEYNGSAFIEILAPPDYSLRDYLSATDCNFLWMSSIDSGWADPYHWTILKEARDCPPSPPPPPAAVTIIPEHLRDYDKIDLRFDGSDRGWCWSEIIFDWGIPPPCSPPPCPDPVYRVGFEHSSGKIPWFQDFSKPFAVTVPLKDDQSYIASLMSVTKEATQPLIVMADNLVPKGISTVSLFMKPTQDYFKLSATTDNDIKIPLKLTLLNAQGKAIWEKEFIAPFSTEITDKVKEPGQTLYFTIPETLQKTITSFNFYPNPARGQLNLEVKTRNKNVNTEVTIASLQGEILLKKMMQAPFTHNLTLPPCKPGLYILKLKTADELLSKLVWID